MTKTVFKGVIDDKTFDNVEEFQKYLAEHEDAKFKSISYKTTTAEEPEEKETEVQVQEPVKSSDVLYPEILDTDKFVENNKDDYDEGLDKVAEYLCDQAKKHKQAIKELNTELLIEHRDNIARLLENSDNLVVKAEEAENILRSEIDELHEKLEDKVEKLETLCAGNELINLYNDQYLELEEQIDEELKFREAKKNKEKKPVKPVRSNVLEEINKLLADIFDLC